MICAIYIPRSYRYIKEEHKFFYVDAGGAQIIVNERKERRGGVYLLTTPKFIFKIGITRDMYYYLYKFF